MSECQIQKLTVGWLETNCYLVKDQSTNLGFVIDPGGDPDLIIDAIKKMNLQPISIINTHGHGDHISANAAISETYQLPIWIHQLDEPMLSASDLNLSTQFGFKVISPKGARHLKDHDILEYGHSKLKVIHTPGHTQGSICLADDKMLISGDTLFFQSIGRTDLLGGNHQHILNSIKKKLLILDDHLMVYPGHGNNTTVVHEK